MTKQSNMKPMAVPPVASNALADNVIGVFAPWCRGSLGHQHDFVRLPARKMVEKFVDLGEVGGASNDKLKLPERERVDERLKRGGVEPALLVKQVPLAAGVSCVAFDRSGVTQLRADAHQVAVKL